jgi:hypothetical protein
MTQLSRLSRTARASKAEFGTSRGVNITGGDGRLRSLRKLRWVGVERRGLWATILVLGGAAAVLGHNVASADEAITKGLRLTYLVTEDERTLAIWGPEVSEEPGEIVTNTVQLPVPVRMLEEILAILSNPANFPDGALEYVIVVKGGSSTAVCHTQNGQFHCHPPS